MRRAGLRKSRERLVASGCDPRRRFAAALSLRRAHLLPDVERRALADARQSTASARRTPRSIHNGKRFLAKLRDAADAPVDLFATTISRFRGAGHDTGATNAIPTVCAGGLPQGRAGGGSPRPDRQTTGDVSISGMESGAPVRTRSGASSPGALAHA